jgi:hypothetical protein
VLPWLLLLSVPHPSPELLIYHQTQELQAKKAELRSNQQGGTAHKDKSGWGSKLGKCA